MQKKLNLIKKINAVLHKIVIPVNTINLIVGFVMGIAYVYLPFTSIPGLIFGILIAISGSVSIGISYFFTSKNSKSNKDQKDTNEKQDEKPSLKNTKASNLFLFFMTPIMLLCSAGVFFHMYEGIILLAAALLIPVSPAAIITVAIVLASIMTVGTLINLWFQTHNLWEGLKKPALSAEETNRKEIAEPTLAKDSMQKTHTPESGHILTEEKTATTAKIFQEPATKPTLFGNSHKPIIRRESEPVMKPRQWA